MPQKIDYAALANQARQGGVSTPSVDYSALAEQAKKNSEPKTLTGFASNVLSSGGNFLKDIVTGIPQMAKMAVLGTLNPVEFNSKMGADLNMAYPELKEALKNRYGGLEQIKNTAYNDPVGMAADVSTVIDPLAYLAGASKLPRIASVLSKTSEFTNPASLIGKVAKPVLREAGIDSVLATVRPSPDLRADFGSRRIAKTIVDEGLTSAASVEEPLEKGKAAVDALLAAEDAKRPKIRGMLPPAREHVPLGPAPSPQGGRAVLSPADVEGPIPFGVDQQFSGTPEGRGIADTLGGPGVVVRDNPTLGAPGRVLKGQERGVHIDDLVNEVLGDPMATASRRAKLGEPDLMPQLRQRIQALKDAFPSGDIPLPEANQLKRDAQQLAYESGRDNLTVNKAAQQAEARALKTGIENRVPAVGPLNEHEQSLIGASRALYDAEKRDANLQHILSLMFGGALGITHNPIEGLLLGGVGLTANSPAIGTRLGIGLDRAGKFAGSPITSRTALPLRLAGASQKQ